MISDQETSDLNNSVAVKKIKSGLNPDAETFFSKKADISTASTNLKTAHEPLTNGDVKADDAGGGLYSQDSPVSASPPAPTGPTGESLEKEGQEANPSRSIDAKSRPPQPVDTVSGNPQAEADSAMEKAEAAKPAEALAPVERAEDASVQGAEASLPCKDHSSQSQDATSLAVVDNGPVNTDGQENAEETMKASGSAEVTSRQSTSSPELRKQLLSQLEYYFSRDNLEQDHYLQSQMDDDQYVNITTIANFNQVVKLTRDYDLIVEVLRSSSHVQVDATGTKVRPKYNRSVLMLREIPQDTPRSEVEAIFQHEKCPKVVSCEFAHNGYWYIRFKTDKDANAAFLFLREYEVKFKDKPVMARIKANSLVRSVGVSSHYAQSNVMLGGQQQPQQNGVMPFIPQQPQAQYPMMAGPLPQYISQHHVQQPVPQFQLFNFPPVLPQWAAANATPHFLDPGAMLAINGYQAASIKSNNHSRNMFHQIRSSNRGMGKHRTQSLTSDKMLDSRSGDRTHLHNNPSARLNNPRSTNHPAPDLRSLPSGRSRSEGSGGLLGTQATASAVSAAPTPLVPVSSGQNSHSVVPSSRTDSAVTVPHPSRRMNTDFRRGGNYRKPRRTDEGTRNIRPHPGPGNKEPHFDLQATSFPPLPGSLNNASSNEASDGSRLSDVVKGAVASRSANEAEEKVKPSTSTMAATTSSNTPTSAAANKSTASTSTSAANLAPGSSSTAAVVSQGTIEKSATPSTAFLTAEPVCDKSTTVDSSKHLAKPSKASGQAASPAALKPVNETQSASAKPAARSNSTPVKPASAPPSSSAVHSVPASCPGAAPAKLSYAQMVARKQAENAVKISVENGVTSEAAVPVSAAAAPSTQSEPTAAVAASVSVSASPKAANATARPSPKEHPRRDYEPREQRFQGSRRTRDYRENRQTRFEPRRSDRGAKVPATTK
ncbi:uncharacterized protein LOC143292601 isoform X2 [Babylonia areolata]|uniref:uncharacterized protein LOC143292601 isoform X2 n=1 Tax=Babylonia areolata TaxID=304850 RepID=UPI003FD0CF05